LRISKGVAGLAAANLVLTSALFAQTWVQQSPATSPAARAWHATAYDAARGQIVLFGGLGNSGYLNDTWVWDGVTWTQKFPAITPPARGLFGLIYDAAHQQVLMFGGAGDGGNAGYFNDTWAWDGNNWRQLSSQNSPSPRDQVQMAYDERRGQVVLFGGYTTLVGTLGDTWIWDGTNWEQESPSTSPPPTLGDPMVYDSTSQNVFLYEAINQQNWMWTGNNWIQESSTVKPYLRAPSVADDPLHGEVILFGGQGVSCANCFGNDTYAWNAADWSLLSPPVSPPGRELSSLAFDRGRGTAMLFGGLGAGNVLLNDTWVWSGGSPVPYVQQLMPTSVAPGGPPFTLTIKGAGFQPGAMVKWNGASLASNFAGQGKLTATVPAEDIALAGTASITVANPGPSIPSNVAFFSVASPAHNLSFTNAEGSPIPLASGSNWVALGDFNGDGKLDMAAVEGAAREVTILIGNGDGTFTSSMIVDPDIGNPNAVVSGDFNGDGLLDLAVTHDRAPNAGSATIFLGNGDGTFVGVPTSSPTGIGPHSLACGDFNGDGKLDLAIANEGGGLSGITILLGNGDGTFTAGASFSTGASPRSLVIGDFNQDGKLDLAVSNLAGNTGSTLSIFLGNGDGTFAPEPPIGAPDSTFAFPLATGDFNADGKLDVAVANEGSNSVSILLGNGDGTFAAQSAQPTTGTEPIWIAPADLTTNAKLDLAIANQNSDSVTLLSGNADGTFVSAPSLSLPDQIPHAFITAADVNGDGRPDLIVANSSTLSVLLQSPAVTQTGTITVTTNLPGATFTLIGPATYHGSGTSGTFADAPPGAYTITFGALNGYVTPAPQNQVLTVGGTVSIDAMYSPINLTASPASLAFSYQLGSRSIQRKQVTLSNNGPSIPFSVMPVTGGSVPQWLSVSSSSAVTPAVLTLSASPGLPVGSYSGQILILSNSAVNSPLRLSVNLDVAPNAALSKSTVVLIVPGIFGTKLASNSEVVWLSNGAIFDTAIGGRELQQLEYDPTGQPYTQLSTQAIENGRDFGGLLNLASDSSTCTTHLPRH
jgi:hypothetical protein